MKESEWAKLRKDDLDSHIGFWLKGSVYVWVPGDTPEECHRYYIFYGEKEKENFFLFLENSHYPGKDIMKIKPLAKDPLEPNFVLFPFSGKNCEMVKNCFSVWVYDLNPYEIGELRLEGVSLSSWGASTKVPNKFTIINPKTNYVKEIQLKSILKPPPKPN